MESINIDSIKKIQEVIQNFDLRVTVLDSEKAKILKSRTIAVNLISELENFTKKEEVDLKKSKKGKEAILIQDYPLDKRKEEKVIFILHHIKRVALMNELQEVIKSNEGSASKETLKSFYYLLTKRMVMDGTLAFARIANSKRHQFYTLPEFLDSNGKLKPEHFPSEESWGSLPLNKRKIENTRWYIYKRKEY